jgi:catechol 2,3-dioxygenase-like lactoylglutathione lyase family enzyme
VIAYATLGTNDFQRALKFYDTLLGEMGAKRLLEMDRLVAWAVTPGQPMLAVCKPYDGKAATAGNGTMISLGCDSKERVDAMYKKAIALGCKDEGAPGQRGPGFYIGYFRDLDGNKLNFFTMN